MESCLLCQRRGQRFWIAGHIKTRRPAVCDLQYNGHWSRKRFTSRFLWLCFSMISRTLLFSIFCLFVFVVLDSPVWLVLLNRCCIEYFWLMSCHRTWQVCTIRLPRFFHAAVLSCCGSLVLSEFLTLFRLDPCFSISMYFLVLFSWVMVYAGLFLTKRTKQNKK